MEAEDILVSLLWGLPFLAIAGVFYGMAVWKKAKGQGFHAQAQDLLSSGKHGEARDLLLEALWSANEEAHLERRILGDLGRLYGEVGVPFSPADYEVLIGQYERLSKKGSHKALSEIAKVQALKKELIDRMPGIG